MAKSTVLVVDDDPAIVGLLEAALEEQGYDVVAAVEDEALRVAHMRHPEVILLDLNMPGMDGLEVSRRLRDDPSTADIPIIAMSTVHTLAGATAKMPVDDRLPKPFDLDHLYDTVAHWTASAHPRAGADSKA